MTTHALLKPPARIVGIFALVHFPWPGLAQLFAGYFSLVTAPLLAPLTRRGVRLALSSAPPPAPKWSVMVDAVNLLTHQVARGELDVRRVAWLPLGVFVALLVAFPVTRWKRRIAVAAVGLLAIQASWAVPVLSNFGDAQAGFFELSRLGHTLAVVAERGLLTLPGMAYALPALLWFVLTWSLERELM